MTPQDSAAPGAPSSAETRFQPETRRRNPAGYAGVSTVMQPKIVRVLLAESTRGTGTKDDPLRVVAELCTLDGLLLGEYDPQTGESRMYPEGLKRLGFKHEVPVVR